MVEYKIAEAWDLLLTLKEEPLPRNRFSLVKKLLGETHRVRERSRFSRQREHNKEDLVQQAFARIQEGFGSDWFEHKANQERSKILEEFSKAIGSESRGEERRHRQDGEVRNSLTKGPGTIRSLADHRGKKSEARTTDTSGVTIGAEKRRPPPMVPSLRVLVVARSVVDPPNALSFRSWADFAVHNRDLKAGFNGLVLGPVWGENSPFCREQFPYGAVRDFLEGWSTLIALIPGHRYRAQDQGTSINPRSPGPCYQKTSEVLAILGAAEVIRPSSDLPLAITSACQLSEEEILYLLGRDSLGDSAPELALAGPKKHAVDYEKWLTYKNGGSVGGTFSMGLARVSILPFDREDLDARSIEILSELIRTLHSSPRVVPYWANFERRNGYRGNNFLAQFGIEKVIRLKLEPVQARFLDVLLEMAAESPTRAVATNAVRAEVIRRRAVKVGESDASGGLDNVSKIIDQINDAFWNNMCQIGAQPYEVIKRDPDLQGHVAPGSWGQFQEAREN